MIQAPTIGRSLVSGTDLVLLVVISLTALLLADIGMAKDGTEQGMQGPSAGPTTDAPSGNRVYRIADDAALLEDLRRVVAQKAIAVPCAGYRAV